MEQAKLKGIRHATVERSNDQSVSETPADSSPEGGGAIPASVSGLLVARKQAMAQCPRR